jgi:hypothetical protein
MIPLFWISNAGSKSSSPVFLSGKAFQFILGSDCAVHPLNIRDILLVEIITIRFEIIHSRMLFPSKFTNKDQLRIHVVPFLPTDRKQKVVQFHHPDVCYVHTFLKYAQTSGPGQSLHRVTFFVLACTFIRPTLFNHGKNPLHS